ncbi:MAG: hypothetical protein B7Z51_08555, partial [Methyloversatilis sp. 12-65-5]
AVIAVSDLEGMEPGVFAPGPLSGVPILLKDNIETADMPTTAGSMALLDNAPGRDAPLVARLRAAGAVILPPSPGFYHQPQGIDDLVDFVVARVLDQLHVPHDLLPRWGEAPTE